MEYTEYTPEEDVIAEAAAAQAQAEQKERVLIDSLPYIDAYDDAAQTAAQSLIQQEMARFANPHQAETVTVAFSVRFQSLPFSVSNYDLPEHITDFFPSSIQSPSLNADWERVEKNGGAGWTQPLEVTDLKVPAANAGVAEWEAAVERAKIQFEYAKNRLELLELQQQFGANSWLAFNKVYESIRDHFKAVLQGYKTKMEQINIQRKTQQLRAKSKLASMEATWQETTHRNVEVEAACKRLEAELGVSSN